MTEIEDEQAVRAMIMKLAAESSIEVTPRGAAKVESFSDLLRLDDSSVYGSARARVYITFLPGSDVRDTTATAVRLAREGIIPIPHIAARSLTSASMLSDALKSWVCDAGVEEVLLIGGAVSRPLGPFGSSMDVLRLGLLERHGITRLGLAGHPEGCPDISASLCARALAEKERYALLHGLESYTITQFCFEYAPIKKWLRTTPRTIIGLPGLATLKTLITHARQCGIGNSMRLLLKRARDVTQLVATRAPDNLLRGLAQESIKDETLAKRLGGVHLYPLGGVSKTARWRKSVAEGRFHLQEKGFDTKA